MARRERLAAELRANLHKRKAQARARSPPAQLLERPAASPATSTTAIPRGSDVPVIAAPCFPGLNRAEGAIIRPQAFFNDTGGQHGSHQDRRRPEAEGHDPDLRRQERGAAADDRQPADLRPAHAQERAQSGRRGPARTHPAQPRRRPLDRGQARRARPATSARPITSPRATSSTPPRPTRWSRACARASGCSAPLLARCGEARVSLPGGCAIGTRPVDLHLQGAEGARRRDRHRRRLRRRQRAKSGLRGGRIVFPKVSVGATHARPAGGRPGATARPSSRTPRASRRSATSRTASSRWARRSRASARRRLRIQGRDRLDGATHTVLPDRIETGTFAIAVAATGGDVVLEGARADLLETALDALRATGVEVDRRPTTASASRRNGRGHRAGQRSRRSRSPASRPTCRRSSWR